MDHKSILDEHFMMIRYTNMIGRLATLGLITVLLALTGFAIWTTVVTLKLSDAVGEAVSVNDLYERAHFGLATEESLEHEYSFEPSLDVRSQFQMAAALLVKDLKKEAAFVSPCPWPVIPPPEAYRIVETCMFAHQVFFFSMQGRPAEMRLTHKSGARS